MHRCCGFVGELLRRKHIDRSGPSHVLVVYRKPHNPGSVCLWFQENDTFRSNCAPGVRKTTPSEPRTLCHTWTFPDSRRHLRLCFPLSISFLCTFLFSLESALIYHRFPLQSRLERRSVLKKICAIPGPSRTVGVTFVFAFLLTFLSSAHFFPLQSSLGETKL